MQALAPETSRKLANMSFLCSLLVVLIHVWSPPQVGSPAWWLYSMTGFRSIAVPFFFLMSGYLLAGRIGEDGWWKRENLKRVRTLLVPYLIWSVLWLLFLLCRQVADNAAHGVALVQGLGALVADRTLFGLDLFRHPQLSTLWYVRSLLLLVVCSPVLMWALRKSRCLVLGLAFVKLFFYKGETGGTWYYLADHGLSLGFVFYFLFGMALRKGLVAIPRLNRVAVGTAALVVQAVFCGAYALLGPDFLAGLPWPLRFAYVRLETVDTLLWLYFIWSVPPVWKLPPLLANAAFPVYLVHWFVLEGLWQHYAYELPDTVGELLLSVGVGIVGTLLVVVWLRRFAPKASSVLFGQRG